MPKSSPEQLTEDQQYRLVHEAIVAIRSQCDGASSRDFVGFDGGDVPFGHRIAAIPFEDWTDDIKCEAARILGRKYHGQARQATGVVIDRLPVVVREVENTTYAAARQQAREIIARRNAHKDRSVKLVKLTNGGHQLHVRWGKKDPAFQTLYQIVKSNGCKWDGSVWWISRDAVSRQFLQQLLDVGLEIPAEIESVFESAPERPVLGTVVIEGDVLKVTVNGYLGDAFYSFRGLAGYQWAKNPREVSFVSATAENVAWLVAHDFQIADGVNDLVVSQTVAAQQAAVLEDELAAASKVSKGDSNYDHLLPEGQHAYDFQNAGVDYALKVRRCLIGDEMGLGKTIQALLTVEAAGTFPVLVVCPASLKGNWLREIGLRLPGRLVTVLSGRKADEAALQGFDFVVANYDIIAGWADAFIGHGFNGVIFDESHYVKEQKSKRTKAAVAIAQSIPANGIRLCLTGTPVLNRPKELVTQLQVLDRLSDVAGKSKRNPAGAFLYRYCGPETNQWGTTFNGATNLAELNDRLRRTCFVRRLRADVLDMHETHRVQIPLSLNGDLNDYRRAEEDIIRYLSEEIGTAAALKAKRAEVLVQLNTLRRLAEEAKVAATIEWVEDWLESYPEKSLVIFAGHVSVQKALAAHFNCPTILGSQKDVEEQKAIFQSRQHRIIVCSLQAAREGHTLTAASDVVFTSLGWTPGGLQQAEDRCNRIGQEADLVQAWQLHAADTIDEEIARLIENKRRVFKAAIDGTDTDVDDDILSGVVDYLKSK